MREVEPSDQPGDEHLVKRMVGGDRDAFAALFRRHHRLVYRFCVQMTGSRDLAEDLTQDVFVALAQKGPGYESVKGVAANLFVRYRTASAPAEQKEARLAAEVDLDVLAPAWKRWHRRRCYRDRQQSRWPLPRELRGKALQRLHAGGDHRYRAGAA
jgi:RNA polymerase sigma-70 factor (ECF subfamily)